MLPILTNFSPFPADVAAQLDPHARQYFLIVLSASFEARPREPIRIADEQPKLAEVDVFHGAPGVSSVKYDADFVLDKPNVDVLVNGAAYSRGRAATRLDVELRIAGVLDKTLVVSGDRFWRRGVLGSVPSSPEPFTRMPIVYERAFGGTKGDAMDLRNPVGVGHAGAVSTDPEVRSEVPNVEYPGSVMTSSGDKRIPAGFGVVARSWLPRRAFAGTYDDGWKANQFPLVPLDFDTRFHQAAANDQQVQRLRGGEAVSVSNMTPDGDWTFAIPSLTIPVQLRYADHVDGISVRTDTIVIEPDFCRVTLKARAVVSLRRNAPPLEEVVVGRGSRAWWRARRTGKQYIGRVGVHDGTGEYFSV
jgi:hypothetical protein